MLYALILAGGVGSRFWPKSSVSNPKQFLRIFGNQSLLQTTVSRVRPLIHKDCIYVVGNERYMERIREQLPDIADTNLIIEPEARETAAGIGLGAVKLIKRDPQAVMAVLPSDHFIGNEQDFRRYLAWAAEYAHTSRMLVTFGIRPTEPKTGYGYIQIGRLLLQDGVHRIYQAKEFTEKPDFERALHFLQTGMYLWNSGMFVWRVATLLQAFRQHMPSMYTRLSRIYDALDTPQEQEVIREEYRNMEKVSVDYGLMEKADNVAVIPADFAWDDVGSWRSLERFLPHDDKGNIVNGLHVGIDTYGSIIESDDMLITTIGVRDLLIVQADRSLLVADKERDQEIKELVKRIDMRDLREFL
ncbi:mannose-1-phosphate guanylyltransferase [Collibacillus ludicampi]|jgi:mannose-1-phosphate guanylyltransferase|uniref:mannose-1-phosphate guanylyltransferase n=1 Tax=Collibacillus ludicampi TaxID=2771369 RepID=A0AAV4LA18_9BACL|nr:mannose-1-phosphate guanylyltransferase [Collibacillus ludicampi]GIM44627.1 mannose-1-phosphate guanylyltransferase [Collibacillus ludicampi]